MSFDDYAFSHEHDERDEHGIVHHRREDSNPHHHRNHRHRSHTARNVSLTVVAIAIITIAVAALLGVKLYKQAQEVKSEESQALALLSNVQNVSQLNNAAAVSAILPKLQAHTAKAANIANGGLWKLATHVPVYGDDITTVRGMTQTMNSFATQALPQLSKTIQTMLGSKLNSGNRQINVQPIIDAQSGFSEANKDIQSDLDQLKWLPEPHLAEVKQPYDLAIQQFTAVSDQIDQINNLIQVMPKFLGSGGTRTYVIMAQTTSEARSSGGLVGSLGSFTANNGSISVGSFHPNAEFINLGGSHANAQEEEVFKSPLDFSFDIRDLAAFPDFSRTAESVKSVWQVSKYKTSVDGVMGIDPVFVQEMIGISGNVTLPTGQVLTGSNTAQFMLNGVYKDVPVSEQDAYFSYVASAAMNNVFSNMTATKMIKIAQSFSSLANQRHLYLYSFHSDEAKYFQGAGLAKNAPNSETDPETGIYLNENNPSKLDWYVHRKTVITRTSYNQNGSQTYHVAFTATNTIPSADLASGNTYILGGTGNIGAPGTPVERILFYAPQGGSIRNFSVSGNAEQPTQVSMDGKKPWTSVATIAPGKSVTYSYDVTTSINATSDLTLDQTPMGWLDPEVTYKTDTK
ncbi:DUF4012 domain-containing protein [Bifidobacterium aquikefiri]|uniref:DUF4012 domain-containing protein n=2 Tax=Bifidobacterium aquikefiri TaxID=1653207 RepID=UPI0039E9B476